MKKAVLLACTGIEKGHFTGLKQNDNLPVLGMPVAYGRQAQYSLFDALIFRIMSDLTARHEFTGGPYSEHEGAPKHISHNMIPASLASRVAARLGSEISAKVGSFDDVVNILPKEAVFAVWATMADRDEEGDIVHSGMAWEVGTPRELAKIFSQPPDGGSKNNRWRTLVWVNVTSAAHDVLRIAGENDDAEALDVYERIKRGELAAH